MSEKILIFLTILTIVYIFIIIGVFVYIQFINNVAEHIKQCREKYGENCTITILN